MTDMQDQRAIDHPATKHLLRYFAADHLPPGLRQVSEPMHELAMTLAETLPPGPEALTALRKLLEAQDCIMLAALDETSTTIGQAADTAAAAPPERRLLRDRHGDLWLTYPERPGLLWFSADRDCLAVDVEQVEKLYGPLRQVPWPHCND